jgi:phosphohistidine swiveling domain-containing protein
MAWGLFAGLEGLPTIEAARAAAASAQARAEALPEVPARFGHRGPGELRPDANRWSEPAAAWHHLAGLAPLRTASSAENLRTEAERALVQPGAQGTGAETLRRAQELCRAVDTAWDAVTMVIAASQQWAAAAAAEARSQRLIALPDDVLYLELEELKQIATGEWHEGYSAEVQARIAGRRTRPPQAQPPPSGHSPSSAGAGQASGPAYLAAPGAAPSAPPPAGAIWFSESADPGCAPFWLAAGAVVVAAPDPWAPGLIAARALGLPAIAGAAAAVTHARAGQWVTVDAGRGRITEL